ncbi:peptidoglycan-binding protein [Frankia sp. Cr1]|uniref:peptidoglycan-binding protein n=1 Tax=Frankia sp. Cr1 TaxID=3073931 RepID=UPI002AD55723|nr:peptidoglycan-binding protein [Frankia sp. Cr1]
MRRRRLRTGLVVAAATLIILAAAAASVGFGWRGEPTVQEPPGTALPTTIKQETLVDYITADGKVGYGAGSPVASGMNGTVTWLPPPGATVERGQALLRVNDLPVVLLYGQLPMYRQLTVGVRGNDVAQFEQNLQALGFQGFTVDQEFSTATEAAVRHWQHDLGLPETGTVEPGQVIYSADPLRVAEQLVRVGATSPADVLTITGTTKVVTVSIAEADAGWAVRGAAVTVALPSGATVAGTVSSVAQPPAAADSNGGGSKVQLTIAVEDQHALAAAEGTLTVRHAIREKKDVLTVPVAALLALTEGGYGLEIVEAGGSRTVAVQAGMFAAGRVEVSGAELHAGMTVRMPA